MANIFVESISELCNLLIRKLILFRKFVILPKLNHSFLKSLKTNPEVIDQLYFFFSYSKLLKKLSMTKHKSSQTNRTFSTDFHSVFTKIILGTYVLIILYVILFAIWYHLHNLKNAKNTHGEVILFVKLQDEASK